MTPDAEAALLRTLSRLVRGGDARTAQFEKLEAKLDGYVETSNERFQEVRKDMERIREELRDDVAEIRMRLNRHSDRAESTGKHDVSRLEQELERYRRELSAAEDKVSATNQKAIDVRRDWLKLAASVLFGFAASIATQLIMHALR